jgi:glutathione S-transferase
MAIKLHRCPNIWVKLGGHPCWRVQRELDAKGIDYEIVKEPFVRSKRDNVERMTGGRKLPFVEFEDGTVLREESKDLAARIRRGELRPLAASNGKGS